MMRAWKITVLVALACALVVGVPGCFLAFLFTADPTLSFSQLVGTVGGPGEIMVSVTAMPGDGLGALAVGTDGGGFRYDPTQFQVTGVVGLNGFVILTVCIDNTKGAVRFVVANPTGGEVTGNVARIVGNRLGGGSPGFDVSKADLQLCDAQNEPIEDYNLTVGQAPPYYIKGER